MLTVRTISPADHAAQVATTHDEASVSFLQTPGWAHAKPEWRAESIGWLQDGECVGAALVLYRQLPKLKRYLAYLPEGPIIDWESDDLDAWLAPMAAHLSRQGAFAIRMGPPVITRRWSAQQVKDGIADDDVRRLDDLAPLERRPTGARVVAQLQELGWRPQSVASGFAAGQPQYNFQLPLVTSATTEAKSEPKSEDDVLKGMNQQWRRNIRKADKAGVEVSASSTGGGGADPADLAAFHDLYVHTAERDGFTPRPLSYFRAMFDALAAEDPDRIRLWMARHDGDLVASTISIRVGRHVWYSYGASSTDKREVQGSSAAQWAMIRDALSAGAEVYDLRGITDTLDPDDSHVGLIRFKAGTGGEAVEYAGEWDLPLNRPLYAAFDAWMKRRSSRRSLRELLRGRS